MTAPATDVAHNLPFRPPKTRDTGKGVAIAHFHLLVLAEHSQVLQALGVTVLLMEISFAAVYIVYAFVFTWGYDTLFPPQRTGRTTHNG